MEKGFSLITVLAVLVMIATGTATVLQAVGSHTTMKSNNLQEEKMRFLAEAGMRYALWKCRTSCSPSSVPPLPTAACPTVSTHGGERITIISTDDTWIAADTETNGYKIQVCTEYTDV